MRWFALAAGLAALAAAPAARADGPPALRRSVTVEHRERGDAPVLGPRWAPVTIEFFCDLSDGSMTARLYQNLLALAERHPQRLRVVFRLVGYRSRGDVLAEAATEAFAQGRFHEFMAAAYAGGQLPSRLKLEAIAGAAGLDFEALKQALADGRHAAALDRTLAYRRRRLGAPRVPLLFNGRAPARLPRSLEDLEAAYDEAYARGWALLASGVPLPLLYGRLLAEADRAQLGAPVGQGAADEPVGVELPPPGPPPIVAGRLDLSGPLSRGPDDAPVVIAFLCSFQSRFCAQLYERLEEIRQSYPDEVRIVFKHRFDERDENQRDARLVHEASLCAADQGRFWEFYDLMYGQFSVPIGVPGLERRAEALGLDGDAFLACVHERRHRAEVTADLDAAAAAGVWRTPALVIGGRLYTGTKSYEELRGLVNAELMPGWLDRLAPAPTL